MRRSTTLAALARREKVLVGALGVAATAVALLAGLLGAPWLVAGGFVVAAAGAALRFVIIVRRSVLESRQDRRHFERLLLTPVKSINDIDPTRIGVDPAAQTILPGENLPEYVERDADVRVRDAISAAMEGRGRRLVVVHGPSKTGKSRTLFEALRNIGDPRLQLVAPENGAALEKLLDPAQGLHLRDHPAVLWLDDLEPFLNDGMTVRTLHEWCDYGPSRFVVATYGGKGREKVADSATSELATIAGEVLSHFEEIDLAATTDGEIARLGSKVSEQDFAAIRRHGLAAFLVAGPALERKLNTGIHGVDKPCWEGVAVVKAAVDWARCGRTDPVSDQQLRHLWSDDAVEAGLQATDEGFEAGLEWALQPVAGTVALLQRADSYRAYDYVIRLEHEKRSPEPPRDSAWSAATETAADAQALTVGLAAHSYDLFKQAASAYMKAWESPNSSVAASAGYNLALALGDLDQPADAITTYDKVVNRYGGDDDVTVREAVARALFNKGVLLGQHRQDRPTEAITAYEQVVNRYAEDPSPTLREQAAKALIAKGQTLAEQDQFSEAILAYEQAVNSFGQDPASRVRELAAMAQVNKGNTLRRQSKPTEAITAYKQVVNDFGDDTHPGVREAVARALVNCGATHAERSQYVDALVFVNHAIDAYASDPTPALREAVAKALFNKGVTLGNLDRADEAIAVFGEVVNRFGEDSTIGIRKEVARALMEMGIALGQEGRLTDAISAFDEVVARFSYDATPALREAVAYASDARQRLRDGKTE